MKREVISVLVQNHAGVLARVSSLFARRGFNIDSLTVSATNDPAISRITVVVHDDEKVLDQIIKQTARLEDVAHIAQSQGGQSFSVTGAPEAQNVLRGFRLGRETKDGVRRFHIRAQNARQQIQSRAFAAAARPYKGDQLPPADVKGRYGQTEALRSGALLADAAQRIHQIVMLHEKQGRELYTEAHLRAGALCPDKARAELCCAGPESGGPPPGVSRGCAGHCLRRSGKRPVPGEAPASVVTRPGACCH